LWDPWRRLTTTKEKTRALEIRASQPQIQKQSQHNTCHQALARTKYGRTITKKQNRFCAAQPAVILGSDKALLIGTVAYGRPMDPPYTPYKDLPDELRKEMQLLQHYKDRVNIEARKVVDVAVTEWQKANARAARADRGHGGRFLAPWRVGHSEHAQT
jgi:hypothetical protein